jgi:hypothetical protein
VTTQLQLNKYYYYYYYYYYYNMVQRRIFEPEEGNLTCGLLELIHVNPLTYTFRLIILRCLIQEDVSGTCSTDGKNLKCVAVN